MISVKHHLFGITIALLASGSIAGARGPARNVRPVNHPNIAAAQRLSSEAFDRLETAQKANEFDLGGHAQKAKDALKLANDEMKLAAETSNRNQP
jgi:hypothetical protein